MVKSGQAIVAEFVTSDAATGAATDADSLPTALLTVDGTDDAASVTVTDVGTGRYKAAVTLPALTAGQCVAIIASATVGGIAGKAIVWQDGADTVALSDLPSDADVNAACDTAIADAALATAAALTTVEGKLDDTYDDLGDVRTVVDAVLVDTGTTLDDKLDAVKLKTDNLPADPADQSLVEAKVDSLGARTVTVAAPVVIDSSSVVLYVGDAYLAGYGRQVELTVTGVPVLLDLLDPDATVRMHATQLTLDATLVTKLSDTSYVIRFEPTAEDTSKLTPDKQKYQVKVFFAEEDPATISRGNLFARDTIPSVA